MQLSKFAANIVLTSIMVISSFSNLVVGEFDFNTHYLSSLNITSKDYPCTMASDYLVLFSCSGNKVVVADAQTLVSG